MAQALTVIVAPMLGVLLVIPANNRRLMGDLRNRWWQNAVAAVGLVAILATCYQLVVTTFEPHAGFRYPGVGATSTNDSSVGPQAQMPGPTALCAPRTSRRRPRSWPADPSASAQSAP